ncbi:hypothetical protein [Janibacter massiliensis]|uniref:hypothetical protein n=1 Tax=Janibacter massiliensis TaxID=2058291 RepID=UPI000D10C08F|nr:hypothetical protein [Janibacter massiliensis]
MTVTPTVPDLAVIRTCLDNVIAEATTALHDAGSHHAAAAACAPLATALVALRDAATEIRVAELVTARGAQS